MTSQAISLLVHRRDSHSWSWTDQCRVPERAW